MSWTVFQCKNPDFAVRSIPDNITIPVSRIALQASEVFKDMFSCCDLPSSDGRNEVLDLDETAAVLTIMMHLMHVPPTAPVEVLNDSELLFKENPKTVYDTSTVIPLPILSSVIFYLVDKYAFDRSIMETLGVHLLAHAPRHPLPVYGLAIYHGFDAIAAEASQYLAPLASYHLAEVKCIPTVEAYHKVLRLQDFRVKALSELLLGEDIFPHGYGACSSHQQDTRTSWDTKRRALVGRIETGTDVAGEMAVLVDAMQRCKLCHKACTAAVEMLAYKCRKVPRRIDQLARKVDL